MSNIIIFTGPTQSGKTTKLLTKYRNLTNVGGFLCPDMDGLRHFYSLANHDLQPFQLSTPEKEAIVQIGRFIFKGSVFDKAKNILNHYLSNKWAYFIIDEIGKLEMEGKGLEPALSQFLMKFMAEDNKSTILIIIVRETLLLEVKNKYNLDEAVVLGMHEL